MLHANKSHTFGCYSHDINRVEQEQSFSVKNLLSPKSKCLQFSSGANLDFTKIPKLDFSLEEYKNEKKKRKEVI